MNGLFRDPAEWATSNGWISRRRAKNIAAKIEAVVVAMEESMADDEGIEVWTNELRAIRRTLAPKTTRQERQIARMW